MYKYINNKRSLNYIKIHLIMPTMEKEILASEWEQRAANSSCTTPSATSASAVLLAIMKNNDDNIAPTTVLESRSDIEYCPTAHPTADDDALYHHMSGHRAIRDGDTPTNIAIVSSSQSQEQSPYPASDTQITTNSRITTNSSDCKQQLTDGMNNLNITSTEEVDVCACCGKEGSDLNICNKCKVAKYCNAACKKKHRSKHKKKCERRVAELHDIELFKEPSNEYGDCPICFLRLPTMASGRKYYECCGKTVCGGCSHAPVYDNHGNIIVTKKCPFCRTPFAVSHAENIIRLEKRMEVGDAYAFFMVGNHIFLGESGLPQDRAKAIGLWRKAGKFGYANLGNVYYNGDGAERDEQMARHYDELAAMEGNVTARHNLGVSEDNASNYDRALKHFMIAVRGGHTNSVKAIQQLYIDGHATKDHYANALRSHQAYINEIKSDQRDKAAALRDDCRYH